MTRLITYREFGVLASDRGSPGTQNNPANQFADSILLLTGTCQWASFLFQSREYNSTKFLVCGLRSEVGDVSKSPGG